MSPPRYYDEKNETRHAATSEEACTNMEEKYGWQLKNVEESGNSILSVIAFLMEIASFRRRQWT